MKKRGFAQSAWQRLVGPWKQDAEAGSPDSEIGNPEAYAIAAEPLRVLPEPASEVIHIPLGPPSKTRECAEQLAEAASQFPFLGEVTARDLLALVRAELGSAEALDDFQPYGEHFAKAVGPGTILHIISGNTPAAGFQSLIRGLLLGSHNLCKIPTNGLMEIQEFRRLLPDELAARVEIKRELPAEWLEKADAVIVFGNDRTIAEFRSRMRPGQIFVGHGHRLSFGVIFDDPDLSSATGAARDASIFDQQGCLSPHVFFVAEEPLAYAAKLAAEMERMHVNEPRGALSIADANAIRQERADLAFRLANDEPVAVFESVNSTAWTVAFDATPGFPHSPLNRFVFVKPFPEDFAKSLVQVRPHLSCAGIWPPTLENARKLTDLGVSRICPVGRMQLPPATWHQDGHQVLAPLVRWIDCETGP
ncbi:MAG: acyl-CoA reductase [Chthoniobacter sp.]|nr:acyl-CoA reductase [Chthoniobacter sp.]